MVHLVERRDRQHDNKRRTMSFAFAVRAHCSAVQFDEVTHDRQTESHAAMLPAGLLIRLAETIENVRQKLRRDSLTSVADDNLEMRVHPLRTNLHAPATRRE